MSSLIPSGSASGSGSMSLVAPVTNSNRTVTVPDADGTVMVSGNMPAFSAYASAAQSISSGVATKVAINTKIFDTATAYDATTNYRFTPLVAGYYQVNGVVRVTGTSMSASWASIYKNGSIYQRGNEFNNSLQVASQLVVSTLIYMNGSTDYIELYGYVSATSPTFDNATTAATSFFSASLVRSA